MRFCSYRRDRVDGCCSSDRAVSVSSYVNLYEGQMGVHVWSILIYFHKFNRIYYIADSF